MQIFVANPNKKKEVLDILLKNKEKLIDFLSKFQSDRKGKFYMFVIPSCFVIRVHLTLMQGAYFEILACA